MKINKLSFSDCNLVDNYFVTVNGCDLVCFNPNRSPMMSKALKFASKGFYTELWYMHSNGNTVLVKYWN